MCDLALIKTPGADIADTIEAYIKEICFVPSQCARFQSGEGKGTILQSVRGKDLFIVCDVTNTDSSYLIKGYENHMSPDDHFANLKRLIHAASGKASRITVIMPFLYESRQHKRGGRESLDCAMALQELESMGVDNLITLDAHHLEVMNAVPTMGFESISASYQFLKLFLKNEKPDLSNLICVSPDEGGTNRAVKLANMMHCQMGMYYKRRDCTQVIDGKNPVVDHVYLGPDVKDKDVIIVDDMIASGYSVRDTAEELKQKGASRVYIYTTFGLFTEGYTEFDIMYCNKTINGVYCTNSIHESYDLRYKPWYHSIDVSEYLAHIITAIHNDSSISDIIEPNIKIQQLITEYNS